MPATFDYDPETGELLGEAPKANIGEYSVSEISQALKRTLEDRFGHVRVRGEISGFRGPHSSGHCYFSIKDEGAKIDAVIWRGVFGRLRSRLQEGLEVIATGKITSYPGKSSYQIVIENIEPAGVGALMALLEERRKKLAAEGLFDAARKKPIPFLPKLIGVVTSPTGAVIRDILHRLGDRFPRRVLVWPVRVQGDTCAAEVAAAIAGFNAMAEKPDVIIVARGGGSLEDLWGFNEEIVVRAAAASAIPLIAAVGHETDTTLIDHAADLRAPTPTAAAERAVPVRADLIANLASLAARHTRGLSRLMDERRGRVISAARALPKPDDLLALARQRFDAAAGRLGQGLRSNTQQHRARLANAAARLQHRTLSAAVSQQRKDLKGLSDRSARALRQLVAGKRQALAVPLSPRSLGNAIALQRKSLIGLKDRADRAIRRLVDQRRQFLAAETKLLASLSYRSVLQRGYALVRDAKGQPVRAAAEVKPFQPLTLEFADGKVKVKEDGAPKQGSLF